MTADMNALIRAAAGHGPPPEDDDDTTAPSGPTDMNDRVRAAALASRHNVSADEALRHVQRTRTDSSDEETR